MKKEQNQTNSGNPKHKMYSKKKNPALKPQQKSPALEENTQPECTENNTLQLQIKQGENTNPKNKGKQRPKKRRPRNRKNKEIKIACINVRGAKGKVKSLESTLQAENIHICLITETMFGEHQKYNIKGYNG